MGKTTMHKIDMTTWPRTELFRFFSGVSQPFYSVTFRVDVTNLHAYAKAHGIFFYYALGYLSDGSRRQRGDESPLHRQVSSGTVLSAATKKKHLSSIITVRSYGIFKYIISFFI